MTAPENLHFSQLILSVNELLHKVLLENTDHPWSSGWVENKEGMMDSHQIQCLLEGLRVEASQNHREYLAQKQ